MEHIQSSLVLNDGYYSIDFVDFENKIVENNVKIFISKPPEPKLWRRFC